MLSKTTEIKSICTPVFFMKYELYYSAMGLPQCVRILSEKLQLDHTFCPGSGTIHSIGPKEYFHLIRQGLLTNVIILPEKNDAFILAAEPEGKIYLNQWISLADFAEVILV